MTSIAAVPAGWFVDPTRRHELRFWDGARWTSHVSDAGVPGSDPLAATFQPASAYREDNGFVHFLRFLLIWFLMGLLVYVIVGIVWMAFALAATGRRKRDLLMLLIPVWGTIVIIQTMWRYTARNVYWSGRPDVTSKSLFSGA